MSARSEPEMSGPDGPARVYSGGGGSGRDPRAHAAIVAATRELLLDVGYGRLTIEAVARRAGVGKPTIYRWWRNKAHLVHEAVARPATELEPDTGDVRRDVLHWIRRVAVALGRPEAAAALPGLMLDVAGDEDTSELIEHGTSRPSVDHLRRILAAGQHTGVVRDDVDVGETAELIADLAVGTVIARAVVRRRGGAAPGLDADAFAGEITELVLCGVLAEPCT